MKGLGRVQRTILTVLEEHGARDLSTALPISSLAGDVRHRIGERWTRKPDSLVDVPPDVVELVATLKISSSQPLVEPAASSSISRGIRTLEKRGLVRRVLSRVWLTEDAKANGLNA